MLNSLHTCSDYQEKSSARIINQIRYNFDLGLAAIVVVIPILCFNHTVVTTPVFAFVCTLSLLKLLHSLKTHQTWELLQSALGVFKGVEGRSRGAVFIHEYLQYTTKYTYIVYDWHDRVHDPERSINADARASGNNENTTTKHEITECGHQRLRQIRDAS